MTNKGQKSEQKESKGGKAGLVPASKGAFGAGIILVFFGVIFLGFALYYLITWLIATPTMLWFAALWIGGTICLIVAMVAMAPSRRGGMAKNYERRTSK